MDETVDKTEEQEVRAPTGRGSTIVSHRKRKIANELWTIDKVSWRYLLHATVSFASTTYMRLYGIGLRRQKDCSHRNGYIRRTRTISPTVQLEQWSRQNISSMIYLRNASISRERSTGMGRRLKPIIDIDNSSGIYRLRDFVVSISISPYVDLSSDSRFIPNSYVVAPYKSWQKEFRWVSCLCLCRDRVILLSVSVLLVSALPD